MQVTANRLRIVSRKSPLALQQASLVKQQLQQYYPDLAIEIIGISTSGDQILDRPLNKIGGKGLFVTELENYLLQNKADIAVHSLKDMPAILADGLALGATLARADARDVLVSLKNYSLAQLPSGCLVGTSSLRRQSQLLAVRGDVRVADLRGNVETRLQKLLAGEYTAIILAAAGLERLNLSQWLACPIATDIMLPAAGQGALGIEYCADNLAIQQLIAPLNDLPTDFCVRAERALNAQLDAGCQAPVAAFAVIKNNILTLQGLVGTPDGKTIYIAEQAGAPQEAVLIGERVAELLIAQGARQIIQALKC